MKICDTCETVIHCTKHGCIPKVSVKDAMRLALDALEYIEHNYMSLPAPAEKAITALRKALAEQPAQQEPVEVQEPYCYMDEYGNVKGEYMDWMDEDGGWFPVYKAPLQRKPLTDDEIWREYRFLWPFHPAEERKLASDILMFARAIEAAHGIKENT